MVAADAAALVAPTVSVVAGASGSVIVFETELEVVLGSTKSEVCVRNENCEGAAARLILVDEAVEVMVDETSVEVAVLELLLLGNEMITLDVVVIVLLAAVVVVVLLAETGDVVMAALVVVVLLLDTGVDVGAALVMTDVELSTAVVVVVTSLQRRTISDLS